MRKKIAAGNWKMNLDLSQSRELTYGIKSSKIPKDVTVILGCPTPYLYTIASLLQGQTQIHAAAQNASQYDKGAYTGEVSHQMLSSIGIKHVIIGHSERREYFKESNKILKEKVTKLVEEGFTVIFCCGEPLPVRKKKQQDKYVQNQLKASLFQLSADQMKSVIIAYEPIWAIGTGVTASPAQAQSMHKFIRAQLKSKYGNKVARETSILYGGSVKPANAKELFSKGDVDGGLVGGASLKIDSFGAIMRSFG